MNEGELRQFLEKLLDVDNEVYSTRMAFVFCLSLSAFLWWIPVLGPAIAGYICGRKTGSMVKGFLCSFIAVALLCTIIKGMSAIVLGHGGYPDVPADEAAKVLTGTAGAVADYLQTFFATGTSHMSYTGVGVVTLFGGVGGLLSRQTRKETAYLLSLGATEGSPRQMARSMQLYSMNKEMGFKAFDDCIEQQKMDTNVNSTGDKQKGWKTEGAKAHEIRPVTTTVQTVTSTASTVSGGAPEAQSKEQGNPFTDILERSDRKENN